MYKESSLDSIELGFVVDSIKFELKRVKFEPREVGFWTKLGQVWAWVRSIFELKESSLSLLKFLSEPQKVKGDV
jgi:hypothetical protein